MSRPKVHLRYCSVRDMRLKGQLILLILLVALIPCNPSAEAQIHPEVSITCSPSNIVIDVAPGDTRTGSTTCTAENPTVYVEQVDLSLMSDGLANSGPSSITVPAGGTTDFELTFRGESQMPEGQRMATLSYVVNTANGVPCPTCQNEEVNMLIVIRQFAMFRVEVELPPVNVEVGCSNYIEFKVYNDGNAMDQFKFSLANLDGLIQDGWKVEIPSVSLWIDSRAPPERFRAMIECPQDLEEEPDWSEETAIMKHEVYTNGTIKSFFEFEFTIQSEFASRYGGTVIGDNPFESKISIEVSDHPDNSGSISSLPSLNILLTICAMFGASTVVNREE